MDSYVKNYIIKQKYGNVIGRYKVKIMVLFVFKHVQLENNMLIKINKIIVFFTVQCCILFSQ